MESVFTIGFLMLVTAIGKSLLWDNDAPQHQSHGFRADSIEPARELVLVQAAPSRRPASMPILLASH